MSGLRDTLRHDADEVVIVGGCFFALVIAEEGASNGILQE